MFQILITLLIYMVLVIPIGIYLYHVATKQRTFADPVFDRIDGMIYRICRINREDMHWKTYALNLLMTNAVISGFEAPGTFVPKPQRDSIDGGEPVLQYHYILYDKYKPAALFR